MVLQQVDYNATSTIDTTSAATSTTASATTDDPTNYPPGALPNLSGISSNVTSATGGSTTSPGHAANARFASLQNGASSSSPASNHMDSEFFDRFHQMNRDRDLELERFCKDDSR